MQKMRFSPRFWSRRLFRSHYTFQHVDLSLRLWRATLLGLGLAYAISHLAAAHVMSHVVFGGDMLPQQMLAEANLAVERYPFDPYLRSLRRYVRDQLALWEQSNASRQPGTASVGVGQ